MPVKRQNLAAVVNWLAFALAVYAPLPILVEARGAPLNAEQTRRYVYTARGTIGKLGSISVKIKNGTMAKHARPLPYLVEMPEMRAFKLTHLQDPLLIASASIEARILPSYHLEAYCRPEDLLPVRAVRWKNGVPDVVMDFAKPGKIFVTKAREKKPGLGARIMGRSSAPTYRVKTRRKPVAIGPDVTDLLTAFLRFKQTFAGSGQATKSRYFFAIKKGATSMYAIRFVPGKTKVMHWEVNGETTLREVRKFSCELSYAISFPLTPRMELAHIRKNFLPELAEDGFENQLNEIIGCDWRERRNKTLTLPVSGAIYNRFHDKNEPFEGPFGLADRAIVWIDTKTGLPVLFDGKSYGFNVVVRLEQVEDSSWEK